MFLAVNIGGQGKNKMFNDIIKEEDFDFEKMADELAEKLKEATEIILKHKNRVFVLEDLNAEHKYLSREVVKVLKKYRDHNGGPADFDDLDKTLENI
jgi:hypothetical protein